MGWDWGLIIICVKICKNCFSEDKCGLIFPILDPYSSHMALPMWVQHGTLLQIPHESLMGCPCRTHINTHLGPMWVLYFLLAGEVLIRLWDWVFVGRTFYSQLIHSKDFSIFRVYTVFPFLRERILLDWLQSLVTKYFSYNLFINPLK